MDMTLEEVKQKLADMHSQGVYMILIDSPEFEKIMDDVELQSLVRRRGRLVDVLAVQEGFRITWRSAYEGE